MAERPKRRKYKDNPYALNYSEEENKYTVVFKDEHGRLNKIEVEEEIYNALNSFELDDIKSMNEYDRHIEHSEIYEETLYSRALNKLLNLEDYVIQNLINTELYKAINLLSETQRRRLLLYYFYGLKLEDIARIEGTSFQMISKSIKQGIANLKKILKK